MGKNKGKPADYGVYSYDVAQAFQSRIAGFWRLSSRHFRTDGTRDKNVPQTRRQECLRYMKDGTALAKTKRHRRDIFVAPASKKISQLRQERHLHSGWGERPRLATRDR